MENNKLHITQKLKAEAQALGFSACGISPAEPIEKDIFCFYNKWLEKGYQASMKYLENYPDKRENPALLLEGTKSIVSVALNYCPAQTLPKNEFQLSWYAYGRDYHEVVKEKLEILLMNLQKSFPEREIKGKTFCDTAPILERYWAWRSGLGWIGKNTLLILPHKGSFFFLGELMLNIELEYDHPQENRCGNCTACLDACPTHALESAHLLNANRCLSYLTIENKGNIPEWALDKLGNCIYGCDRCQKACRWNKYCLPSDVTEFQPSERLLAVTTNEWDNLSPEDYQILFKGSAVKRAKYNGLMRNIKAVVNSKSLPKDCERQ